MRKFLFYIKRSRTKILTLLFVVFLIILSILSTGYLDPVIEVKIPLQQSTNYLNSNTESENAIAPVTEANSDTDGYLYTNPKKFEIKGYYIGTRRIKLGEIIHTTFVPLFYIVTLGFLAVLMIWKVKIIYKCEQQTDAEDDEKVEKENE